MSALRVTPSSRSSLTGGVSAHAVADDEHVGRRRLVDVAVGGQDDRLVEAVELRLGLLEGHVHVAADDLAAGRQGLVGVAPPGRGHDPDALRRCRCSSRTGSAMMYSSLLEVVQPDADRPGRLVERRPDVGVLAEAVAADRLDDQPGQLVDRRDVLHQQDPARLADPLDVLAELQPVELPCSAFQ